MVDVSPAGSTASSPRVVALDLSRQGDTTMATITPPQSKAGAANAAPTTSGCHCLVLDISGSMCSEAKVTSDDGDKVSHGFSLLDVVKHATCTYIASLAETDFMSVIVYSTNARVLVHWKQCTEAGKKELDEAVRAISTEGQTNLPAGIELGMEAFGKPPTLSPATRATTR
jgi:hypothetical protein